MADKPGKLTLIAGGDVGPVIEPVDRVAELIVPVLKQADFRLAQCERTYSDRGFYQEWKTIPGGKHTRAEPRIASVFKTAGIDVVSLASNHAMDWGYEPMLDTLDLFRKMGMKVIGAGRTEQEARTPAIIEKDGVKVAILGYCSVLRDGQTVGPGKPGITPARANTYYHPIDFQPGSPPRIISEPLEEDVQAMKQDIAKAKTQADAVVVFIHWGVRWVPKTVATYQPPIGHAAIDAGADIIIGHHAHCPKAIELYKGKIIFYSIGNFMTTGATEARPPTTWHEWNLLWFRIDTDSLYHFPNNCRQTLLAKVEFSKKGVERVACLPAYMNKLAQPEVLKAGDPRFQDIVEHMEWVSDWVPHQFAVEGDEIVVKT